jgi:hypothetical protein
MVWQFATTQSRDCIKDFFLMESRRLGDSELLSRLKKIKSATVRPIRLKRHSAKHVTPLFVHDKLSLFELFNFAFVVQ